MSRPPKAGRGPNWAEEVVELLQISSFPVRCDNIVFAAVF